jgi:E3 ubiquitin-protein ligase RNF38/44
MRALRPRPPAPAPSPADVFVARIISSPPAPYAAGSPAPEPSAVVAAAGGRRGGGASLSPPLIAMVAVVGAALLVVLYARLVSRVFRAARRRLRLRLLTVPGSPSGSNSFASFTTYNNYYHTFSPYQLHGLDDAAIKSLPSAQLCVGAAGAECAVCLLELARGEEVRALPRCTPAFHADCIDAWLRAHASCPLCRAAVALPPPLPSPRRARPSLDDLLFFHPVPADAEIAPAAAASPDRPLDPRDFLLKRSYSFGFERSSLAVEASPPWRFRACRGRASFWSKRWPSPFGGGSSAAARVFSFRSYRSAKLFPFSCRWRPSRRRSWPRRGGAARRRAGSGVGTPRRCFRRTGSAAADRRCAERADLGLGPLSVLRRGGGGPWLVRGDGGGQ